MIPQRKFVALFLAGGALVPVIAGAAVSCSVSATGPAFGVYNPLSATPAYANSAVHVSCTLLSGGATTVNLVSSYSTGNSGSYASRSMLSGASVLRYNLYYDAAYTLIRGNGTGGSQMGGATLNLTPGTPTQTASGTIYGRIPAGQDVAAGSYADTIVVTITY
ncbi:MAG: spore coat protein U domain-containing protein [Gammaproteobacteria bacterium]|nr:spore coat protein U domain-containing protein [Gammaproteobacteria bacterium]